MPNGSIAGPAPISDVDITSLHYGEIERPAQNDSLGDLIQDHSVDAIDYEKMAYKLCRILEKKLTAAFEEAPKELRETNQQDPQEPAEWELERWASCSHVSLSPAQRYLLCRVDNDPAYVPDHIEMRSLKVLVLSWKAIERHNGRLRLTGRGKALVAALGGDE